MNCSDPQREQDRESAHRHGGATCIHHGECSYRVLGLGEGQVSTRSPSANFATSQQLVLAKVTEKTKAMGNTLKFVIPNDLVSHVIGKAGTVIKRLQLESGAQLQVNVCTSGA
jgi:hypothetical protein